VSYVFDYIYLFHPHRNSTYQAKSNVYGGWPILSFLEGGSFNVKPLKINPQSALRLILGEQAFQY